VLADALPTWRHATYGDKVPEWLSMAGAILSACKTCCYVSAPAAESG